MINKLLNKIKNSMARDIWEETVWVYSKAFRYHKRIIIFVLLGVISTLLGLGSGIATKYVLDAVFSRSKVVLITYGMLYIGFGLVRILLGSVTKRLSTRLSLDASNEIRADVYKQFIDVDWEASLDYHSGDIITRINSDVNVVADSILGWIPSLFITSFQFLGALIVVLVYDPIMAVIVLLSLPVTILSSRFLVRRMRNFGKRVREEQARMVSFYEESLNHLQAIKSFHLNGHFNGRLLELQRLYKNLSLDYNKFNIFTNLFMSVLGFVTGGLSLAWAAYRLWTGSITPGSMVLFIQLAGFVGSAFSSLVGIFPSVISSTVSARRLMKILDLPKEDYSLSEEAKVVLKNAKTEGVGVYVDNVSFAYRNGRQVFENLSLTANPGEIIGIVSPSGGGKTTLIRLLLGLITPQSGSVTAFSGDNVAALTPSLRHLFTYVAQEKVVFSGSIADSLRLTNLTATDDEIIEALTLSCAYDFVKELPNGIHTLLSERGSRFSDGQIQRLAIARALLSKAPILLLDEATSALDYETERKVVENLVKQSEKRTIIVTTHRPQILAYCTRVYKV